jgi:serine/threonine protein kinase
MVYSARLPARSSPWNGWTARTLGLRLVAAVADALEVAHQAGVIHRDVKPANIFLTYPDGPSAPIPKLVDFGTAKQFEVSQLEDTQIVGTPAYMAPEQVRGDTHVGPRADVYSLGATLYELLSGQPPHQGSNFLATLARLATTPPRRAWLRYALTCRLSLITWYTDCLRCHLKTGQVAPPRWLPRFAKWSNAQVGGPVLSLSQARCVSAPAPFD